MVKSKSYKLAVVDDPVKSSRGVSSTKGSTADAGGGGSDAQSSSAPGTKAPGPSREPPRGIRIHMARPRVTRSKFDARPPLRGVRSGGSHGAYTDYSLVRAERQEAEKQERKVKIPASLLAARMEAERDAGEGADEDAPPPEPRVNLSKFQGTELEPVELPGNSGTAPLDDPIPETANLLEELDGYGTVTARGKRDTGNANGESIMMVTGATKDISNKDMASTSRSLTARGGGKGKGKGKGKGGSKGGKGGAAIAPVEEEVHHPKQGMIQRPPAGHVDIKHSSFAEPAAKARSGRGNKHNMSLYEPPKQRQVASAFDSYDPRECGPVPRVNMSELEREEQEKRAAQTAYDDDNGGYDDYDDVDGNTHRSGDFSPRSRTGGSFNGRPEEIAGDAPYSIPRVTMPGNAALDVMSSMSGGANTITSGLDASTTRGSSRAGSARGSRGSQQALVNVPLRVTPADPDIVAHGPKRTDDGKPLANPAGGGEPQTPGGPASSPRARGAGVSVRRPVRVGNPANDGKLVPTPSQSGLSAKDYLTVAKACERAGRTRHEALAYYNAAVALENQENYGKAVQCYRRYAQLCASMGDRAGEALAHNNMGVAYMYMGRYALAAAAHEAHAGMCGVAGRFVAMCNLGLCHVALAQSGSSASANGNKGVSGGQHGTSGLPDARRCFSEALRYAMRMGDKAGEATVTANLAMAERALERRHPRGPSGSHPSDLGAAKERSFRSTERSGGPTVDQAEGSTLRRLALASEMGDLGGVRDASTRLGELAERRGDHAEAARRFREARDASVSLGDGASSRRAVCALGVAEGNRRLRAFMEEMAHAMGGAGSGGDGDGDGDVGYGQGQQRKRPGNEGRGGEGHDADGKGGLVHAEMHPPRGAPSGTYPPTTLIFSPREGGEEA